MKKFVAKGKKMNTINLQKKYSAIITSPDHL